MDGSTKTEVPSMKRAENVDGKAKIWMEGELLRCYTIEEGRNDRKDHIREPESNGRRQSSCMDKHLAELKEQDVGESQRDTHTDIPSDTSPTLL